MELEPKNLGIPLYRRNWSALWFVLASAGIAWMWHRPTTFPAIVISCLVGGSAIWVFLGPGLNQVREHRSIVVRACCFVGSVVGVVIVMRYVVPWLHSYAATVF
jgi:hypothetical protein